MKRLRVEQLVGENDAAPREYGRLPDAQRASPSEGVGDPREHPTGGFRAKFDKAKFPWIGFAEECDAGGGDEFAENRSARAGGEKIGARIIADA